MAGLVPTLRNAAAEAQLRQHMTQLQSGIGMRGGPENPIGARALYLWHDNKDTLWHQRAVDYRPERFIRLHPFDQR